MTSKTKISKGFQTVVPAEVRNMFDVGPGDILEWIPTENGVEVKFRKKLSLWDIAGIVKTDEKTDAVELKKRVQRGEKI
jgi:AbrB family looped-hinge helix DNA binding protein